MATLRSEIAMMWSFNPWIEIWGDGGRLVRRIELPLTNRRVSAKDFQEGLTAELPYGEPGPFALTNVLRTVNDTVFGMFTSDLWRAAEDPPIPDGQILWRLISVHGRYLGTVEQPEGYRLLGLGDGTIWARVLDSETLLPTLVELELAPPDQG